ncbi:MAG: RNA-binding S4 domain-containing protein [Burkholderiaceae bacterium]
MSTKKPAASSEATHDAGAIRLDKWLWAVRFYRTRSAAAAAIDAGQVRVNEQRVKPAKALHVDDLVTMRIGGIEREVRVRILADVRVAAPIAQTRYAETDVSLAAREAAEARRRLEREPAHARKGRPTKRDRRELATFVERTHDDDRF